MRAFAPAQERDPESLLSPLIQTLRQRRALPAHALFVVPDSSYTSLAKRGDAVVRDTSWQEGLAAIWRTKVAASDPQVGVWDLTVDLCRV